MRFPRATRLVISIAGEPYWLWRAVDQNGFVLDVLVQRRRDSFAAQRLMRKLLKAAVTPPRVMITDKLRFLWRCEGEDGPSRRASPAQGPHMGRFRVKGCNLIVYGDFPFRSFRYPRSEPDSTI